MALLDTAQNFLQGGLGFGGFEGFTSDAPALIIEQEGGDVAIAETPGSLSFSGPKTIILQGRALPNSPLEISGEQRHVTTYYPGNPQATIQVLGTTFGSTTISGVWKYRFVGDPTYQMYELLGFGDLSFNAAIIESAGGAPRTPQQLVEAFENLRDEGKPVLVEWNDQQRRGIISRFSARWLRSQDVEWECEFEWFAAGPDRPRAQNLSLPDEPLVTWSSLLDDILALEPRFLFPDVAAIVTSRIAAVREGVGTIFDFVNFANTQVRTPISALQAVNTAAFEIRLQAEETISRLTDRPYTESSPRDGVLDVLAVEQFNRTVGQRTGELRASAQNTAKSINEQNAPGALQVVVVPAETTLRQLAKKFYGSADDWQLIADINFLNESQVPAGTTLIIPQKPAQRSANSASSTRNNQEQQ
jgi:hypothetical protein